MGGFGAEAAAMARNWQCSRGRSCDLVEAAVEAGGHVGTGGVEGRVRSGRRRQRQLRVAQLGASGATHGVGESNVAEVAINREGQRQRQWDLGGVRAGGGIGRAISRCAM